MDKILISIKPMYMKNIILGNKTIGLRRRVGRLFLPEREIYLYSSAPVKALVAKAFIKKIDKMEVISLGNKKNKILQHACINEYDFDNYFSDSTFCYLIHLKNVRPLIRPMPLKDMREYGINPPQSFCYLRSDEVSFLENYWE